MENNRHAKRAMTPERVSARLDLARAQMHFLIAEVSDDVTVRMEHNLAAAKKQAREFRRLSNCMLELMQVNYEQIDRDDVAFLALCHALRAIGDVVDVFMEAYREFLVDHGGLLEEDVRDTIERFADWACEQPAIFAPYLDRFACELANDLDASAADQKALAEEWSSVDGDGLH